MDATICPWCQTEIVWDEELGPEEECPYCHNELKGYRTLKITLDNEEELEDEEDYDDDPSSAFWHEEDHQHFDAIRRAEAFAAEGGDMLAYETGVETLLDSQEEVPECPHCREYMVYSGKRPLAASSFEPLTPAGLEQPLVRESAKVNVYVCPSCFHVSTFLSEVDRIHLIRNVSSKEE